MELLLNETSGSVLDAVCGALNVSKKEVCVTAGDLKSEEGKFSKTILYYKLAGVSTYLFL